LVCAFFTIGVKYFNILDSVCPQNPIYCVMLALKLIIYE
jgi:hypothetical protein